jgi:hypothetical protein
MAYALLRKEPNMNIGLFATALLPNALAERRALPRLNFPHVVEARQARAVQEAEAVGGSHASYDLV